MSSESCYFAAVKLNRHGSIYNLCNGSDRPHGKKDKKKEDVEEFNTADAGEEKSTVIDETAEGFVVRNGDDDTQGDLDNSDSSDNAAQSQQMLQGDDDDVAQEEQPVEDNPDDEDLLNQESEASVHEPGE